MRSIAEAFNLFVPKEILGTQKVGQHVVFLRCAVCPSEAWRLSLLLRIAYNHAEIQLSCSLKYVRRIVCDHAVLD